MRQGPHDKRKNPPPMACCGQKRNANASRKERNKGKEISEYATAEGSQATKASIGGPQNKKETIVYTVL